MWQTPPSKSHLHSHTHTPQKLSRRAPGLQSTQQHRAPWRCRPAAGAVGGARTPCHAKRVISIDLLPSPAELIECLTHAECLWHVGVAVDVLESHLLLAAYVEHLRDTTARYNSKIQQQQCSGRAASLSARKPDSTCDESHSPTYTQHQLALVQVWRQHGPGPVCKPMLSCWRRVCAFTNRHDSPSAPFRAQPQPYVHMCECSTAAS